MQGMDIGKEICIPVYTLKRECGIGKARTLHRNPLLPIGSICIELEQHHRISKLKPAPKKRTKHIDTPETQTFTVTYDFR